MPVRQRKPARENASPSPDPNDGHMTMVKTLMFADYITLLNCFCGVVSIFSSAQFMKTGDLGVLRRAMAFLPFGLFFDFMDGRVARWRENSSLMGQELDSLADLVSFGVGPATVGYVIGLDSLLDQAVLLFFVLCGLTRLARFNVTVAEIPKDKGGKSKYFEGTPIPTTLSIVAIMFYLERRGLILDQIYGGVYELIPGVSLTAIHPFVLVFALSGCLMTSRTIKIPKP